MGNSELLRQLMAERARLGGGPVTGDLPPPTTLVPNITRPSTPYDAPNPIVPNVIGNRGSQNWRTAEFKKGVDDQGEGPNFRTAEFKKGIDDQGEGPAYRNVSDAGPDIRLHPARSITEQRGMVNDAARQHPIGTDDRTAAIRGMRAQLAGEGQTTPQMFNFTDNTGKYSHEGRLVGYDHNDKVATILRKDGQRTHVHRDRLSPESQQHIEDSGFTRPYGHSEAEDYGVKFAKSKLPPPLAKVDTPAPPEGHQRFTLTDGQQVDGAITGHDPSTRTVNVRKPDGNVISIDVDSLDEQSRGHYDARVNEHGERVAFDEQKKKYEDEHGKGSFSVRQGAVVHTGGGRSVLIPPGAKFGGSKGTASTNPEPAAAPAANPAATAAAQRAVEQTTRNGRPALLEREATGLAGDQEQFARNAAMSRADTANRLASGQGFANVEQQGPLVANGLTDQIMDARAARDATVRDELRATAQFQNEAEAKRKAAMTPEQQAARMEEAKRNASHYDIVQQYKRNQKELQAQGITLQNFINAHEAGAERGLLDQAGLMRNQERMQQKAAARNNITMQAQMRNGGAAARATAMNQLADPNSTDAQREAARLMMANFQGQQAVDFNEHAARERIGMHGANAARDVRIAAQQREGNMKPPEQKPMEVVPDALTTIPAGSDYEGAVTHVAAHMEQAGADATSAEAHANNIVEAQMWNDAKNRRIPADSWQMGKLRQMIHGVDPVTGRVGSPMKKPFFMELARARGIGPQQAAEIYDAATNAVPNNQAPVGI